jgi:hypothetical protein
MIGIRVYLSDPQRCRDVPSDRSALMSLDAATAELDGLSPIDGNFIGFVRDDGEILQFAWNSDGTMDVDVPMPARAGSLSRRASFEECRAILGPFAHGLRASSIPGMRFDKWSPA